MIISTQFLYFLPNFYIFYQISLISTKVRTSSNFIISTKFRIVSLSKGKPFVSRWSDKQKPNVSSNFSGCILGLTLVSFVRLWSTVCFQMGPQITCLRGCIFTLVAFVLLFSSVRFQMGPQTVCPRGCIVTVVAFVWFFSTVCFQMCSQMVRIR